VSFLVAAALGVGLFIAVPIAAHLLRRGRVRERPFPPAALVPPTRSVARERSRLEDRLLLTIRALAILCLAVIGATPFVRCSRLSLGRNAGASVAFALVIDDSHSMRASGANGTRFARSLRAARELLASAREGDAIAIVLAGKPARLALAATTDLQAARSALAAVHESDRATDLGPAVALGRTSLAGLAHHDKRVVLLSDLADGALPEGDPPLWAPVPELTEPLGNCAICSAERHGRRIDARIACTSAEAAHRRSLQLVGGDKGAPSVPLASRAGVQDLGIDADPKLTHPELELTGADSLAADDRAPVSAESAALGLLVVADTATSSAETGGPPILEQGLAALDSNAVLHPVALLPDDPHEYQGNALAVLDDPNGITPEARSALITFVEQGGVAAAFLGPRIERAPLGATLEPFVRGALHWEAKTGLGLDEASLGWLGPEALNLGDLGLHGRAGLATSDLLGARVRVKFSDGEPFLTERSLGRGLLFTVALPASVEQSNFPLRPTFLTLLDALVNEARNRRGAAQSIAGTEWLFPSSSNVAIDGPSGAVGVRERGSAFGAAQKSAVPELAGRYSLRIDDAHEERVAILDAAEITTPPQKPQDPAAFARGAGKTGSVDASPELGFLALALLGLELGLRVLRRTLTARTSHAPSRA